MRISDWSSDVCSSDLQRRKDAKTRRKEKLDSRVRGNDNEIGAAGLLHRHPHNTPASPLAHQRQRPDRPRLVRIVGAELDHLIAIGRRGPPPFPAQPASLPHPHRPPPPPPPPAPA